MRFCFGFIPAAFVASVVLLASYPCAHAQAPGSGPVLTAAAEIPEAPQPQFAVGVAEPPVQQPAPASTPAQNAAAQGSSSSQTLVQAPAAEKSQHEKAEEQLKEQEKQRVLGIVPSFNISYRSDAVSLTAAEKVKLAFRSSTDPVAFAAAFLVAGYHEGMHDDIGFPWGAKGYGERAGAAYLDAFNGSIIGNGILPSILHQDPRYFRLGHGTTTHRMLYALMTNVMCKHDNTGKWEPNYSNVLGNIASGGISNLYYPSNNSGIGQTFTNGFIVTAEGGAGSIFQEFWPDISRKFLHKDPTHGLDAEARKQDAAEKEARKKQKEQK
jgi:hypothetical protein